MPGVAERNLFFLGAEPEGNRFLSVMSVQSSSGIGLKRRFSANRCSELSWRWRISNVIEQADITRKSGDDAAAKLYVIFDGPSRWNPLDKRVLVYLWDNRVSVGSILPNAWQPDRERMWVLESGEAKAGQWVRETVQLAEDFASAFPGEALRDVEALILTSDTDNTGSRSLAAFDDLRVRCVGQPGGEPRS